MTAAEARAEAKAVAVKAAVPTGVAVALVVVATMKAVRVVGAAGMEVKREERAVTAAVEQCAHTCSACTLRTATAESGRCRPERGPCTRGNRNPPAPKRSQQAARPPRSAAAPRRPPCRRCTPARNRPSPCNRAGPRQRRASPRAVC